MCFLMAPQDRIQNCFAEEKQTDVKVLSMHFFDDLICFGPFFSFLMSMEQRHLTVLQLLSLVTATIQHEVLLSFT